MQNYSKLLPVFIIISMVWFPIRLNAQISLAPEENIQLDVNGIPLSYEVGESMSGLVQLSSLDLALSTHGKYSNLSLTRNMNYVEGQSGRSTFSQNGTHNFDFMMVCGGCKISNLSTLDFAVASINAFGASYSFSAYFGNSSFIYDVSGKGNMLERYVYNGLVHFRFIRNDGVIVEFTPDSSTSILGARYDYASAVKYPNGEKLIFEYDNVIAANGNNTSFKRLKKVDDIFGNSLSFEYLDQNNKINTLDVFKNSIIAKISFSKDKEILRNIQYEYDTFPSSGNSSVRQIPRVLRKVSLITNNEEEILEEYTHFNYGSLLAVTSYFFPSQIKNRSGITSTTYQMQSQGGNITLNVGSVDGPQYLYTIPSPNPVNTNSPTLIKTVGNLSESYFIREFPTYYYGVFDNPSDPSWLSHPWTQVAYCDYDEAGTYICPKNRKLSSKRWGNGAEKSFGYDGLGRLNKIANPEGDLQKYDYNERGFVTKVTNKSKDGLQVLISESLYPANCSNYITCNKSMEFKDSKGNITNYSYDPIHGGILTETGPDNPAGVRPQKRFEYVQRYPWIKDSGGAYVHAQDPIWLIASEKICRTTATVNGNCAGGIVDEVSTNFDYGPDAPPNKLFLRGVTVTADGQTLRTCYGIDTLGRRISETKPRADLAQCP